MNQLPVLLISSCLLGENVKYDGGNNALLCAQLQTLRAHAVLIPVCPEVLGGLPVPRIPAENRGERVVNRDGEEVTAAFETGAEKALEAAAVHKAKAALLKERSPSCGVHEIYDGTFSKTTLPGSGTTSRILMKNGIRVFNENEIEECLEYLETI
jgi:uncharacterized protein YbbK (DUF523 family)